MVRKLLILLALLSASAEALLKDPNAAKWREIETQTVVKAWIFGLLEHCPQDVRAVRIPLTVPDDAD